MDIKKSGNGIGNFGYFFLVVGLFMIDLKDFWWIDEYGDELIMVIVIWDWEELVKLVEKGDDFVVSVKNFVYIYVRLSFF